MSGGECGCSCGATRYRVAAPALFRMYCHCTICQEFTGAAHSALSVFAAAAVTLPPAAAVSFGRYRPPPAINRGKCRACGAPSVEVMDLPLLPKLVFVPTANLAPAQQLAPSAHFFYNRRLQAAADGLPKYGGYWPSQLAFGRLYLQALRRRKSVGASSTQS